MAKLNFPGSPSPGTIYTENGNAWQWNGNSWVSYNSLDLTSQVSGALGVTYGGTGYSTYSTGTLLVGAGSSFIKLPVGQDNYVLTASSSSSSGITWSPSSAVASGSGLTILNSLTSGIQYFSAGTSGSIFNISSSGSTHTFNIPIAGVASTGLITTSSQTISGQKTFTSAIVADLTGTATTSGFASTSAYSQQSGYGITAGLATTATYSNQAGYAITSGLATTATYSHQSGYAITSSSSSTSGFATTSTYSYQSGYGITAGIASTSTYSHQAGYATTSGTSGLATTATYSHQAGYAITSGSSSTASTSTYSHQSGYGITAGTATTSTYSHQSGYGITAGTATTSTYSHQSGYGITAGTATTSTYSHQSGYAITSGSSSIATTATYSLQSGYAITSGIATTSRNINTVSANTSATHYLLFSPNDGGSGVAVSSDSSLTYNPSTNVITANIFSGNVSATAVTSTNFFGTLVGNSSTATTAQNVNLASGSNNANHSVVFSLAASGSGIALSSDGDLQYNPSSNSLTVGTGNVTANSVRIGNSSNTIDTSSGNLNIDSTGGQINLNDNVVVQGNLTIQGTTLTVDSTVTTIVDPVIVIGSGAGGTHFTVDNNQDRGIEFRYSNSGTATTGFFGFQDTDFKFRYIPNASLSATNVYSGNVGVIVANIEGNVSATAVTSTNFYGTFVGNSSTATTAQNLNINATTINSTHYITFAPSSSGSGLASSTDLDLTYNPGSNVLTAGVFSGNVSGTAITATNIYGIHVGNVTGTSTTSQNINTVSANTSATHYITFSPVNGGSGVALSSDSNLSFNPSTNVLIADVFSGNVSATAITATNFFGALTGNITGTSTTSQNINTVSANTSATHYLLFSPVNGASGVAVSSDSSLQYNPSTNVIIADVFSGNLSGTAVTATNLFGTLTGNVSGTSTTSQNVNVVSATTNSSHAVLFTPALGSASGAAVSTESSFVYNPSTDILSTSGLAVTSTTTSRSTSSGALIVTGGVGIGGSLYVASATAISGVSINNGVLSTSTLNSSSIAATSSTNSTSTSTGAITVTGGVGVGQSVSVGGRLQLFNGGNYTAFVSSASGNTLYTLPATTPSTGSSVLQSTSAGVMSWVPMTASGGLAVSGTTDGSIQYKSGSGLGATNSLFFDTSLLALRLTGFPAGNLTSGTDAVLKLEATTSSFNGSTNGTYIAVNAGSGFTGDLLNLQVNATSRFRVDSSGSLIQNIGTNSSSTTSGSLQVRGGVGITGAVYIGESVNATSLTQSTSTNNGSLVVSGGAGISAALNVGGVTRIFSSTASTSPSTGALLVAGGLGVSGQLSFVNAALGFTGITTNPSMAFIGATSSAPITLTVLTDNSLSWEGTSGQLFSIDNNLASGEIFAVSDISGLPVISASAGQTINLNEFGGYTQIGNGSLNSSSTSSGSLVIAGGLGMSGNAYIGGTTYVTNTASSSGTSSGSLINTGGFGNLGNAFIGGTTTILSTTSSSGTSSGSLVNTGGFGNLGNAFIGGTTTILSTTSSSGTSSGSLVNTGGFGNLGNAFIGGTTAILSTTSSSSTSSGSLVNSGGFGNVGNAFIGGTTTITNTTDSTSTATGALVVRGGLGLSGNAFIGGISTITNSTSSTSTSSGSLVNSGGFGNAGNAFIGGTTRITNSTNATSSATGALVVSGGVGVGLSLFVGGNLNLIGQMRSGNNTFTKTAGSGDICFDNGTADTPASIYYWQNNRNFGTDVYYSGSGTTRYRIVKELNETGGAELWSIDRDGIVYRTAWAVGETINTAMYNYSDLSMASTTTISSTSYTTIATISYTPKSSTSYLWIEFSCTYNISGSTADDFWSNIEVNAGEIVNSNQIWLNASGGGTRSGVLFPLAARYTNTGTSALTITVRMKRGSSDDNGTVYGNAGSGYMRIQEIGR